MAEVTVMVLKVDLKCCKCYKKVKKVLCKFPEIQDQVFDEKQNTVTIKVVCCYPERMKQKICCKGGKSIQCIKIKPPEKEKPKETEKEKPKESEKKEEKEPKEPKAKCKVIFVHPAPNPPPQPPTKFTVAVTGYPPCYPIYPCYPNYPIRNCCRECSEGRSGGPCEQLSCDRPPCYGRPVYDSCGCGRGSCNKSCYRGCEENDCSIM